MTQDPTFETGVPPTEPTRDERMWGMLAHLSALVGFFVPFGNLIAPLVIWMIKKEESAFVDDQGKEAVNFQITMTIVGIIGAVTACLGIGIVILALVGIVALVFEILAAVQANNGVYYRYPLTYRFIK